MRVERDGGVMTIVNDDVPLNRMSFEYMDGVEEAVEEAAADSSIRALVFTADGDENFSVGMDLKQLMGGAEDRGGFEEVLDQRRRVLDRIENLGKPSIATLFGYCLGGGLELPLACHFRLAALEGAKIGLPELDLGSVPAWGGTARLTRAVGRAAALDVILRVRRLTGPEAHAIGLVQQVHPLAELRRARPRVGPRPGQASTRGRRGGLAVCRAGRGRAPRGSPRSGAGRGSALFGHEGPDRGHAGVHREARARLHR